MTRLKIDPGRKLDDLLLDFEGKLMKMGFVLETLSVHKPGLTVEIAPSSTNYPFFNITRTIKGVKIR